MILKIFGKLAVRTMAFLMFATICVCCSPNEEVLHDEFRKSGKLEVKTFDELRNHPAFQASLERIKIKKQKGDLSRSAFEDQYGFTIAEDMVKVVTDSLGNVTYTMEIIPDEKNDENLLNLILKEQPVDGILGHIVKYNSKVNEGDSEYEIGQKGIASIIDIRDTGEDNTMRYAYIRILVGHCINQPNQGGYCGGNPDHESWTSQCSTWYVISIPIDNSGGGGGGTSNDPPENNSGTGNNNGEPPGGTYENGGVPPVSTSPVRPKAPGYRDFVSNLSGSIGQCYGDMQDQDFKNQIENLFWELDEVGTHSQAIQFANEAIAAACDGGEVDFANKIVLDASFKNSTKLKCVYDKMKQGPSGTLFNKMLQHFKDKTGKTLTFNVEQLPQPTDGGKDWAITSGNEYNSSSFTITSDVDLENQSILYIMTTLCHELIHAYMFDNMAEYGYITFNSIGEPVLDDSLNCSGVNPGTNFSGLSDQDSFLALLCGYLSVQDQSWSHTIFNEGNFDGIIYRQALENYLFQNYSWTNENSMFVTQVQPIFGQGWKSQVAKAMSWLGLQKTSGFDPYLQSLPPAGRDFVETISAYLALSNQSCP